MRIFKKFWIKDVDAPEVKNSYQYVHPVVTVFDPEPMPTAEELFQKVAEDRFFSKIDLSKGYWKIKVAEKDISKTAFITPNGQWKILKMPFGMVNNPNKPFVLRTDASNDGVGAILMQEHEGKLHPVSYGSKKLSNAEKNYSHTEKEYLAIVWRAPS
nr:hypothetical protein BaRGS_005897 [Batillaria attramentaria]